MIPEGPRTDTSLMLFDPQAGVTNVASIDNGRRRRGRVGLEAVRCDLGTVLDLSSSGMRVVCRRVPRGVFTTRIRGLDMTLEVRARVAWSRRTGLFKRVAGLEFLDVTPSLTQKLTRLGMTNRDRRTV